MGMIVEDRIVFKKINEIRPYVRNPRKNEKTVELLCKLIPKVGFNVPIVIDENGIIVKGHARYAAAIKLGMEEVPCIVSHASEDAVKVDRLTDNKIAEHSRWINEQVESEIEGLNFDFDFSELGFSTEKFEGIPQKDEKALSEDVPLAADGFTPEQEKAQEEPQKPAPAPAKYFKCVCPDCGHVMFIKGK